MTTTEDQDREEILRLHREWFEANVGMQLDRARKVFAPQMTNFNVNGFFYDSLDDTHKLWDAVKQILDIKRLGDEKDFELNINGDVAWLTTQATCEVAMLGEAGSG